LLFQKNNCSSLQNTYFYQMKGIRVSITTIFICWFSAIFAQIPPGYYDDAEGLYLDDLRAALQQIINNHQVQTNASLWEHFQSADSKINGKVWDMYSDVPGGTPAYEFTFVIDQCGNYSGEGDCFNREHSFPQSWYNSSAPMSTDLFHLYPADAWVNAQRGNWPYGTVSNANWTSTNGSKRGACSFPGYSGTVFEPIDEYKGDFARSYFYMLTRYMNLVSSWESPMLDGNSFSAWAKEMLLQWDAMDPVSQKEIDRNNTVYTIQGNRNPYIDRPEFVYNVWGTGVYVTEGVTASVNWWYSNNTLNVNTSYEYNSTLEIFNVMGQSVSQISISGGENHIPVNEKPGVYLAVMQMKGGVEVLRFVVQ
jgi:endonuclease I